ncbi:MAG: triose-phosphate isomerase [candidate division Zixibacteria bacterium]|nr:triose-phosphate isomerase [candidate division Zixibacteria bacterium]
MRQIIIAGNWKLNCTIPETQKLIEEMLWDGSETNKALVLVCPPFTSLHHASKLVSGTHIAVGAQDMSAFEKGAYTGEVSADMLLTAGVTHVILGHSERRQFHGESDQQVNVKAKLALAKGLTPIICVGESIEQREADETKKVVGSQVEGTLSGFTADMISRSVIAYEPVWAIGTGKTATPEMAQEVHKFIREKVAAIDSEAAKTLPILYGGSMKPGNAAGLMSQPDIDGGLIGGASLKAADFIGIIKAV